MGSPQSPAPGDRPAPLPPQWRRVRSVGVVGSRGTGKTCYFGATYKLRADRGASLEYQDQNTVEVLKKAWGYMARGEAPPATAVTLPAELGFRLGHRTPGGTRRWSFTTLDYAGEFVQLSTSSAPKLKDEARRWLAGCDAVLFFVGLGDTELLDRLNELNVFVTELKKQAGRKNELAIPVGLVLTKWDAAGPIGGDPEAEDRRAAEFVARDPNFRQIAETIRNCGDWVKVFPVSAFGGFRGAVGPDMQPPPSGAEPFNVLAPLVWAAEQASNLKTERFVRKAKRYAAATAAALALAAAGFGYDTLKYTAARDALAADTATPESVQTACAAYAELPSPFKYLTGRQAEVARGLAEFNDRAAVALAYDRAAKVPSAAHEQEFITLAKTFRDNWPDARDGVRVTDQMAEVRPKLFKRWVDDYLGFRKQNPDEGAAPLRVAQGTDLLARLDGAPEVEQVRLLLAEDQTVADRVANSQKLMARLNEAVAAGGRAKDGEQRYAAVAREDGKWGPEASYTAEAKSAISRFKTELAAADTARDDFWWDTAAARGKATEDRPDDYAAAYQEYLRKGGKRHASEARQALARVAELRETKDWKDTSAYAAANANPTTSEGHRAVRERVHGFLLKHPTGDHRGEAKALLTDVDRRHDDFDWRAVETYIKTNPDQYDRHIPKLDTYLARQPVCSHATDARKRHREAEVGWDRREWARVTEAVAAAQQRRVTGVKIKLAYDAAKAYAEGTHPRKAMLDSANAFTAWFERLKTPHNVAIKVVSAFVEAGNTQLFDPIGNPDCKVVVTLSGVSLSTKQIDDTSAPFFNEMLNHQFSWGTKTLTVRVIDEDPGVDDYVETSFTDDFVIGAVDEEVAIPAGNNKFVRVRLECEAARVPGVFAYPAN